MKKLLAFSLISALVCAAAFAEVSITGGAGASFIPIGAIIPAEKDGGDTELVTGFGRNGGAELNVDLNVEGKTESGKAGFLFQWRPKVTTGGEFKPDAMGNTGVWYRPLDWIRIDAGKFENNDIRGQVGNDRWFGDYTVGAPGEGDIFSNINPTFGAMVSLKPTDALSIYGVVKNVGITYEQFNGNSWGANRGAKWIWQNSQFAVGYALPNIGLVRVQFVGVESPVFSSPTNTVTENTSYTNPSKDTFKDKLAPRVEAAFAYTGISGLTIDVGGKVYFPVSDPTIEVTSDYKDVPDVKDNVFTLKNYSYWKGINAGLGVKYAADPLTVTFIVAGTFAGNSTDETTSGTKIEISDAISLKPSVAVNYKLNDTFTVQGEGGITFTGDSETTTTTSGTAGDPVVTDGNVYYGFGAGLQTTIAPGYTIKTALTYAGGTAKDSTTDKGTQKGVFSVPIIFSASF